MGGGIKTRRVPGTRKSMRDMRRVPSKIYKVISTQKEKITANRSSRAMRSCNFIRRKEINGGGDIMSITTVKIHEKLTKLNGGYKHIDRYSSISGKKTKGDHVNGASYLNMEP